MTTAAAPRTTWQITDPNGVVHTKSSATRVYTHAIVRRNLMADHFFVSWATSLERAQSESRVHAASRDYNVIMKVTPVS